MARMHRWAWCGLLALLGGASGCAAPAAVPSARSAADADSEAAATGGASAGASGAAEPADDPRWPKELVLLSGEGPNLFLGSDASAPQVGYLSSGVRLRRAGPIGGGRAKVFVEGGMKIRAWVPLDRVGLYVQRRGKLKGAPVYLGPGQLVRLVEPTGEGRFRVEARALLRAVPPAEAPPFVGIYPLDRLGIEPPAPGAAEPPRSGRPVRLVAGRKVKLYRRSRGEETWLSLPALRPPLVVEVLKEAGARRGVRVGAGPYLVGYVEGADLGEPVEGPERPRAQVEDSSGRVLPERIAAERDFPLWKVREGAKIYFHRADGTRYVFAILKREGFARELQRFDDTNEVDVFVAVDDRVAVRGLIAERNLLPFEPAESAR